MGGDAVGHCAIGLKRVFKVKRNENGDVVRHKAHLLAKGYVQHAGVDFDEVFAPVARLESVRLMVALAAHKGWQVHHMDVKSAFLNSKLQEVYVQQPPVFITTGSENKVLSPQSSIWSLSSTEGLECQARRHLMALCFQRSHSEHGVYTRSRGGGRLIVGVYVDDLIITRSNVSLIEEFKNFR